MDVGVNFLYKSMLCPGAAWNNSWQAYLACVRGALTCVKFLFIQVPQRVRILDLYITCRRMYVDQELVRSQLEEDASFFHLRIWRS